LSRVRGGRREKERRIHEGTRQTKSQDLKKYKVGQEEIVREKIIIIVIFQMKLF
jgi:hypothetical protein